MRYWRSRSTHDYDTFVYVIEETGDDGPGGPVKIGWAGKPLERMTELQCGNPRSLRIAAVLNGSASKETEVHAVFSGGRLRGEWFSADLREEIIELVYQVGEAQIHAAKTGVRGAWRDEFRAHLVKAMFPPKQEAA